MKHTNTPPLYNYAKHIVIYLYMHKHSWNILTLCMHKIFCWYGSFKCWIFVRAHEHFENRWLEKSVMHVCDSQTALHNDFSLVQVNKAIKSLKSLSFVLKKAFTWTTESAVVCMPGSGVTLEWHTIGAAIVVYFLLLLSPKQPQIKEIQP